MRALACGLYKNTKAMVYGFVSILERFTFLAEFFFHSAAEVTRMVALVEFMETDDISVVS